jgi:hypothetical protein
LETQEDKCPVPRVKIGEDCAELGEDEVVSHAGEQRVRQDGVGGWDVEFFDGVEDLQHVELSPLSLLSFFMSSFVRQSAEQEVTRTQ